MIHTFKEYRRVYRDTVQCRDFLYLALGLAGEAGEFANKAKKIIRDDDGKLTPERRESLLDELGDALWYVNALANELGDSLDGVATRRQSMKPHKISRSEERRLAALRGGERRPASGAGPLKEDVADALMLYQSKATTKGSIGVRYVDLRNLVRHAAGESKMPVMCLRFLRPNPSDNLYAYVVFPIEFDKYFPRARGD